MSLQATADILISRRQGLAKRLKALTPEQWMTQPDGFANNVAWNIGHLIVAQQGLCYARLGVAPTLSKDEMSAYRANYGNGTSPADWEAEPDAAELSRLFVELAEQMTADIAAGKFDNYVKPEPTDGPGLPPAESVLHGFIFNIFHEGFHVGNVDDLLTALK